MFSPKLVIVTFSQNNFNQIISGQMTGATNLPRVRSLWENLKLGSFHINQALV